MFGLLLFLFFLLLALAVVGLDVVVITVLAVSFHDDAALVCHFSSDFLHQKTLIRCRRVLGLHRWTVLLLEQFHFASTHLPIDLQHQVLLLLDLGVLLAAFDLTQPTFVPRLRKAFVVIDRGRARQGFFV